MFLLSYTKSEEFQKLFRDCVLGANFLYPQDRDLVEHRDRIDPGAAVGQYLGHRTKRVFEELNSVDPDSGISYAELFRVIDHTPVDRKEIGRAMVLTDRIFGAIDEIVWTGSLDAFRKFAVSKDFSFNVGREKKLNAAKLRELFHSYFLPAGDSGYSVPSLRIRFKAKIATVDLEFRTDGPEGATWIDRSFIGRSARNAALVAELNWSLQDFRNRLEWMERYRASKPLPGISDDLRYALSDAIRKVYRGTYPDLSDLRPGIYFEDEILEVKIDEGKRGFPGRCVSCQQIVALDVYRLPYYADGRKDDWTSNDAVHYWDLDPEIIPLFREAHRARDCRAHRYISSRDGKEMSIRSY